MLKLKLKDDSVFLVNDLIRNGTHAEYVAQQAHVGMGAPVRFTIFLVGVPACCCRSIHHGFDSKTGNHVAIKIMDKERLEQHRLMECVSREVRGSGGKGSGQPDKRLPLPVSRCGSALPRL